MGGRYPRFNKSSRGSKMGGFLPISTSTSIDHPSFCPRPKPLACFESAENVPQAQRITTNQTTVARRPIPALLMCDFRTTCAFPHFQPLAPPEIYCPAWPCPAGSHGLDPSTPFSLGMGVPRKPKSRGVLVVKLAVINAGFEGATEKGNCRYFLTFSPSMFSSYHCSTCITITFSFLYIVHEPG